ncbi:hypothetical protein CCMSSC00406_0007982 [Pleurotus cornucopiae]|uniref:Uncharacterized protein n=1 Tax=Pleurotus cornucopiae TaxID=5321 RepID=A0ACB7IJN5_PLECO|nr:hypothetical protein CCMSSC00406_0007982 [Pleurotus cornucopiae]
MEPCFDPLMPCGTVTRGLRQALHEKLPNMANTMSSQVASPSTTRVMSIDLERPIISLAENISTSMSALYWLHAALFNVYEESSPEVLEFIDFKREITSSWEQWATLLQESMGFARDYIGVCHSLQSDASAENIASANAILSSAHRLRRDMAYHKQAYEELVQQFSSLGTNFERKFSDVNSGVNGAAPGLQRLKFFQAAPHRGISEAYTRSIRALNESYIPVSDISVFWEDFATHLSKVAKSGDLHSKLKQELYFQREVSTWISFHDTLTRVVESILSSCDASAVSPINQSHQWKKLISRVRPKRRLLSGLPSSAQPDNVTPSGVSSVEGAESPQVLTNPNKFDVQIITDSMATIHACLHALLVRDTLRRNFRKGRFRVKDRLLGQISAYIQSLPDVEEAASSGIVICQKIRSLLEKQDRRSIIVEIRDEVVGLSELTGRTLSQYQRIYPILQAEIAMRKAKKKDTPPPQEDALKDLDRVRSRVLLAQTGSAMNQLIQHQQQFHLYWSHLALDIDRFEGEIVANVEILRGWSVQEQFLRAYCDEALHGKQLENASYTPSKANWLRTLKGFGRKRGRTVDDAGSGSRK